MLIAQSFGARMKNMPHLSRLLDPPGTKGGPHAHFRRSPPKQPLVLGGGFTRDQRPFGPGSWLNSGPKGGGAWSRVVAGIMTKGPLLYIPAPPLLCLLPNTWSFS